MIHTSSVALTLLQIIKDCILSEVRQCMSNDAKTPRYKHKPLILNLSCGASIMEALVQFLQLQG